MSIISQIVGRMHVSQSDEDVCLYLISRLKKRAWEKMSPEAQADVVHTAIQVHAENLALYNRVMGTNYKRSA